MTAAAAQAARADERATESRRSEFRAAERDAALYACRLRHVRRTPLRNDFSYRTYLWLVDLDAVPRPAGLLRLLADFRAEDHFGPRTAPVNDADSAHDGIRERVDAYLAQRGIDLGGGRILMLANARVFGYVFNPLSVFWCHDASGALRCVLAEVHNTYGQRHCYLLRPDGLGRAQADKHFYVSPFYRADEGSYHMSLPVPDERLALTIRLDPPGGGPPFVASLHGRRRAASAARLLLFAARYPLATLVVSARIRVQGVKLYLRGLKVQPRPAAGPGEKGS